jgi:hypothetical protein
LFSGTLIIKSAAFPHIWGGQYYIIIEKTM